MTETIEKQHPRYRFVDCRFDLQNPGRARDLYQQGHIPGAVYMDLETQLSGEKTGVNGRHPLPNTEDFTRDASAAGIHPGVTVVAYDDGMTGGAARLWWLLRHFGHPDCAVLAGGIQHWWGPVRTGAETCEPGRFRPAVAPHDTIEADELRARLDDPRLAIVDARAPARYRGEQEPIDPVAGHIPGAINIPFSADLAMVDEVRDVEEIAVYCGSGVTACVVLLALARSGRDDARLYPGSWSEWASRDYPCER